MAIALQDNAVKTRNVNKVIAIMKMKMKKLLQIMTVGMLGVSQLV